MKTLPTEVWTMIARLSKRQQPPPRVQANWNDDFNQQDLVSLMRVNKSMYQIVAPILYDEPIVQNIGLFFLGVEQQTSGHNEINGQADVVSQSETVTDNTTIPYHKRHLLDLVTTLHVIRASSRLPVDECYMEHWGSGRLISAEHMDYVKCDTLGRGKIDGWILAESLLSRLADQSNSTLRWEEAFPFISFRHLTALTFGLWDDGRWGIYEGKAHTRQRDDETEEHKRCMVEKGRYHDSDEEEDSDIEKDESASSYVCCEETLAAFLFRTLGRQAVNICQHTSLGLSIFGDPYCEKSYRGNRPWRVFCPVEGLRVIHGCRVLGHTSSHDGQIISAGPTQVFSKYSQGRYDDQWSTAKKMYEFHNRHLQRSLEAHDTCYPGCLTEGCDSATTICLDICVLLETGSANAGPQEAQIKAEIEQGWELVMATIMKHKADLEVLETGGSEQLGFRSLLYSTIPLNVYVGADIPPCPVCGLKE